MTEKNTEGRIVYRIERQKYLEQTLSGKGASLSQGNRWNGEGTFMVYTSESSALAHLEFAMHVDLSEDAPTDRYLVRILIPTYLAIEEVSRLELPPSWDSSPPLAITRDFGDYYMEKGSCAVLKVPSVVAPYSYNYLLNPFHEDFKAIQVLSSEKLNFDKRLFQ